MPHIVFVPFTGFRVREDEMRELGMSLPGFKQRAAAIAELPALGLLTLAGMLPDSWTCCYHGAPSANEGVIERILAEQPDLVAVSALTASIEEAYRFCQRVREAGVETRLIALTGYGQPADVARSRQAGFDDHLVKPLDPNKLTRVLRQLERPPGGQVVCAAGE